MGKPLPRVAVVHSFYSSDQPSGENNVVDQQVAALERAGCEVVLYSLRTDDLREEHLYSLKAASRTVFGFGPAPDFSDFRPDVIHVHNLFPNFGIRWLKSAPAPIVATLHNFRPFCSAGVFFREGSTCTECLDKHSSLPAVLHGCYRNRAASVPVALSRKFERDPVFLESAGLISPSAEMWDILVKAGVPREKLALVPHFLPDFLDPGPGDGGDFWLYAGRLSRQKGILELVRDWPASHHLVVVGAGELEPELRLMATGKSIDFRGELPRSELVALMRQALGLIFPSRSFETFGLAYMEALSAGTPVIAWDPCVVASFLRRDGTGIDASSLSLAQALDSGANLFPSLRTRCREVFELHYSETVHVSSLLQLYASIVQGGGRLAQNE